MQGLVLCLCVCCLCNSLAMATKALKLLNTGEIRKWLLRIDLDDAPGTDFGRLRINGRHLAVANDSSFDTAKFPNAQPLHWDLFWAELQKLKRHGLRVFGAGT